MKISEDKIKLIYKDILFEKKPSNRLNCPSIDKIIRLYRGKFLFNKSKLLNHLDNCFYCAQEIQLISNIVSEEIILFDNFASIKQKKKSINVINNAYRIFYYFFHKYRTVSLFLIMTLITSVFLINKYPIKTHLRSSSSNTIIIIKSHKIKKTNYSIDLMWKEIHNSKYYQIEVFDYELVLLWKSAKTNDTNISFPIELINRMHKGYTYYYIITCFLSDGRSIESQIEYFIF